MYSSFVQTEIVDEINEWNAETNRIFWQIFIFKIANAHVSYALAIHFTF